MRKYVTIPDIRQYSSYKSVNARLVYMHACMGMDINTRNYAHSWRQIAEELLMPLQQVRTALKQLEKDGLIATQNVTQQVTYGLTQRVTHKVTQIHIMSINELDEATNEATNSPTNSPTNADINNKNNSTSEKLPHTRAREHVGELKKLLEEEFNMGDGQAREFVKTFLRRQDLKGKTWQDVGDLKAHLVSWAEKHLRTKPKAKRTDTQARAEEYQRAADEAANKTNEDKQQDELRTILAWIHDGEAKMANAKTDKDKAKWAAYVTIQRAAYQDKIKKSNQS